MAHRVQHITHTRLCVVHTGLPTTHMAAPMVIQAVTPIIILLPIICVVNPPPLEGLGATSPPYYIYAREGEGATEGVATLIFDGLMARIIFLSSSVSTGGRYFTPFFDLRTYEKGYKSTKNITLCEKLQYL